MLSARDEQASLSKELPSLGSLFAILRFSLPAMRESPTLLSTEHTGPLFVGYLDKKFKQKGYLSVHGNVEIDTQKSSP